MAKSVQKRSAKTALKRQAVTANVAAQAQNGYRAGHGAHQASRPGADHQRGATDHHHEEDFDGVVAP